ncbi:MAG: polysaccharide biosynthesis tyrosine autokinase [Oculatellaceae cyanobacterium bins.114]|nr:polysaccharide biosynthesis tyrosine autokinase [Oculatellaceae cyanobacterium bins.114]
MEPKDNYEEIDLQKYWLVLNRRWLPATGVFGIVVILASTVALSQKPTYEAQGKLLFRSDRTQSLTGLGEGVGQLEALGQGTSPLDTQAEIVRSIPVLQATIEALDLKDDEGNFIEPNRLASELVVKDIPGTDILQISYRADDPEMAAIIVNKVIEVYIKNNIQSNRAEAVSAREFIVQQLPRTETAVRNADQALRQFKEQNQVIALQEEANTAVATISNLDNQISQAQAELADTTARLEQLRSRIGINSQQAVAIAALSQAQGVQEVLTQLQEAQQQLAVERTRYRPGHPAIANLERRVNALNDLLNERTAQIVGQSQSTSLGDLQVGELQQGLISNLITLETERQGLAQRITTLTNAQSNYKERASVLPRLETTQRELERQLQAAQTTYETLLTQLQEVQVTENQNIGNARVISPALVPTNPIASRSKLILLAGVVIGGLLGITAAFALDLTDRSIKTLKEAKELFRFTLLGVIPNFKTTKNNLQLEGDRSLPRLVPNDFPRSPIAEAYQMLQANLKFVRSDHKLRTIVITSSVPQEGKSEVSANLALTMAQVGRRVLLVDADMRHPSQHHIWQLTNSAGLSNVIIDQVSLEGTVQEVAPNLHVLPCGVIPPNPIALLDSKRMATLVDTFADSYDFVIFDMPPLGGIADAAVLGKMVDGVLIVVRPGVLNFSNANAAKEFLMQSNQQVLGMVVNGVDIKHEPDSYFYYTRDQIESVSKSQSLASVEAAQDDRSDPV